MLYRVLQTAADVLLTAFLIGLVLMPIQIAVSIMMGEILTSGETSITAAGHFVVRTINQLIALSMCIHIILYLLFKR